MNKMITMNRATIAILFLCFFMFSSVVDAQQYRSISGVGNNIDQPNLGAAGTAQLRWVPSEYADGISSPNGEERYNPRGVSNYIFEQNTVISNEMGLSDYLWVFGQFVDHDITLVLNESSYIEVKIPEEDEYFVPNSSMHVSRAKGIEGSGTSVDNPRSYRNEISSFIDASNVYGSDDDRANWLRSFVDGKLKVSEGNLMPWNTISGDFNDAKSNSAPEMFDDVNSGTKLFVAGDVRANENPLLIGMHTIFLREHNRICDLLKEKYPILSDEELYQRARKWIGAYVQSIVYNEWLPAMGVRLTPYTGYNSNIDPSISTIFSTTAFRFGHTLINEDMIRMDSKGDELPQGSMKLSHGFFNPTAVIISQGIESFLVGMGTQMHQESDCKMIGSLRNFLFGEPEAGGIDLATINIVRAREKGIPSFNKVRAQLGLPMIPSFENLTRNSEGANNLQYIYSTMDNIDPWVGMLSEYHMPGALFGNTIVSILRRQFENLRTGDRFFFENDNFFNDEDLVLIKQTKLYDIVMRNTNINKMQSNLFVAMPQTDIPNGPELLPLDFEVAIYPNPTHGISTIKVYSELDQSFQLKCYNMDARLIFEQTHDLSKGENFLNVDITDDFLRGVYNIVLQSENSYNIVRLVKE